MSLGERRETEPRFAPRRRSWTPPSACAFIDAPDERHRERLRRCRSCLGAIAGGSSVPRLVLVLRGSLGLDLWCLH
jgi:hypothetical protein